MKDLENMVEQLVNGISDPELKRILRGVIGKTQVEAKVLLLSVQLDSLSKSISEQADILANALGPHLLENATLALEDEIKTLDPDEAVAQIRKLALDMHETIGQISREFIKTASLNTLEDYQQKKIKIRKLVKKLEPRGNNKTE